MDSSIKVVYFALFVVTVIITEVYCRNSTFHGYSTSNETAQVLSNSPQNPLGSSFSTNQLAWVSRNNISNPRISSWSDINSRAIYRPYYNYTNNSRIPVYSKLGHKNETSHDNTSAPKYDVDDNELKNFSEELLQRDDNNAFKYITVNNQSKTTSGSSQDLAPEPLLHVNTNVNRIPTINKIKRLYDNYIVFVDDNEVPTSEERQEEDDLLDTMINTNVMEYTRHFLVSKGVIGSDPREFKNVLKEIWFTLYPRRKGRLGSSGFEHIFLAEIKNGQVSGFHNWIYFNDQELKNNVDYLGYMKILDLGNKGAIIKNHFKFRGYDKPVGSQFIGTSPEFEMALYTTCFLIRPDKVCKLQLGGKRFIIRAYTINHEGKKLIGSAFPEI
ncbi:hypothetical protein RI129_002623 [Pyrocoelia pectoralis]|uniref:EndoU domain-containing protein n=1 Tax=Pyrocoelia pectoralis TaxID=417401 RepID=A0AAN7VMA3_9COLE